MFSQPRPRWAVPGLYAMRIYTFYQNRMHTRPPEARGGGHGCPFTTGGGVGIAEDFRPVDRSRLARDRLLQAAMKNYSEAGSAKEVRRLLHEMRSWVLISDGPSLYDAVRFKHLTTGGGHDSD